jgi:hypothetical protein
MVEKDADETDRSITVSTKDDPSSDERTGTPGQRRPDEYCLEARAHHDV